MRPIYPTLDVSSWNPEQKLRKTSIPETQYVDILASIHQTFFYNLVLFISSVAVFSLVAQRMGGAKPSK
ncbi:hypothetical protein PAAG_12546 [Paracoccidioides lutzii Pb01]|uniref:Uncharacterized protein n=1 Tax=Paracoccidioides lutzii (strain ATCC MYA-826 / Pb01) TaxID=502779 RepID=A0A0A2UYY9_PARBA|nr:hypothetical protein PAAG_12546 [Paracoccidioides lutzii Pb01]KGQ00786.1 hypothetical protein PAAG_12546 [Paracoccidioides lutzii Pb01]